MSRGHRFPARRHYPKRVPSLLQAIKQRLRRWTKPDNRALALDVALDLTCSKSELMIENTLLRRQLTVLNRQVERPQLTGIRSNTAAFYFPDGLAGRLVRFINPGRMPLERSIIVFLASKLRGWKDAV